MESGLVWWCRLLLLAGVVTVGCRGHGRLLEPVSRASAWRLGWPTPVDYDDNQGFCGGFWRQHEVNSGKCGICGDPWDEEQRPHEAPGGPYATGTIVRHYVQAQVITLIVDITSNHRGHFEVSICPDPEVEATQECLDMYPLPLADGSGYEYNISLNTGEHSLQLMLPPHLTCTHCVLQCTGACPAVSAICKTSTTVIWKVLSCQVFSSGIYPRENHFLNVKLMGRVEPVWRTQE